MTISRFIELEWFIIESSRNLPEDSQVDIRSVVQGKIKNISNEQKQLLIGNRKPRKGHEFPARTYTDNRRLDGKVNRYCKPEWFEFLAYSKQEDGIYRLSCILFPTQKWFLSSKTYHNTLGKSKESKRITT